MREGLLSVDLCVQYPGRLSTDLDKQVAVLDHLVHHGTINGYQLIKLTASKAILEGLAKDARRKGL